MKSLRQWLLKAFIPLGGCIFVFSIWAPPSAWARLSVEISSCEESEAGSGNGYIKSLLDHLRIPASRGMEIKEAGIYGEDGRTYVSDRQLYPFTTIGKVNRVEQTGPCTGTLVSACHVLTAAHCVVEADGKRRRIEDFESAFGAGRSGVGPVVFGGTDFDKNRGVDWAMVRLNKRLGNKRGFMGIAKRSGSDLLGKNFYISCYSWDFMWGKGLYLEKKAEVVKTTRWLWMGNDNIIKLRADTAGGCSGSVLFEVDEQGNAWVVGVHNAAQIGYDENYRPYNPKFSDSETSKLGTAVASAEFFEKAQEFMEKNPCTGLEALEPDEFYRWQPAK